MSDILQTILRRKAEEVAERGARVPLAELAARCEGLPPTRGFAVKKSTTPIGGVSLMTPCSIR